MPCWQSDRDDSVSLIAWQDKFYDTVDKSKDNMN